MQLHGMYWWVDRWRKSSAYMQMTLEEQGAYRNLLDEAWLRGGVLPLEETLLARASGDAQRWKAVRRVVLKRFIKRADGYHNETLDETLHQAVRRATNQRAYRERQRRKNGHGNGH